ncbi:MAG: hypothetical protein EXR32_05145 [Betaproteobacteria bacterium]|nr:hypothetical protein [Betaproteobacteria bacterium]
MRAILRATLCGMLLALAGCAGEFSGTARGLFTGYVTDKTEEEVVARVGKPESVDSKPNTLRWTYKKKTFDPDNQSLVDAETILLFQKDASGKFKCTQVIFG